VVGAHLDDVGGRTFQVANISPKKAEVTN